MIPATTKMSSRGQVVIPAWIRQYLRLEPGTQFIVVAKDDVIVLKRVTEPLWKDFDGLTTEARRQGHHMDLAMQSLKKAFTKMMRSAR
jgi:AbrB family looped-hinge helix DNA binding protein